MKINKKLSKEKEWFKFDGKVEFQIRPYRFSIMKLDDVSVSVKEQFIYCLCDWRGLTDEGDKPFACTDENKLYLYDYYGDVREFVIEHIRELQEKLDAQLKNLKR